ncbi:phage tail assembly chaperone G [Planococcus sp. SE5232]|uniref:phage tail assembly chaperone G n=1 Tax=unclassified Planococcus (in: firmicutes) TaxID=2662419 RepID=UPI003D6B4C08
MAKSIELVVDFKTGEKKEFFQPSYIKGSVALEALVIGKSVEKKGNDLEPADIKKMADFVSKKVYGGEFTADQLIDGIHAPNLFEEIMAHLGSVMGDESGNATKAKKN